MHDKAIIKVMPMQVAILYRDIAGCKKKKGGGGGGCSSQAQSPVTLIMWYSVMTASLSAGALKNRWAYIYIHWARQSCFAINCRQTASTATHALSLSASSSCHYVYLYVSLLVQLVGRLKITTCTEPLGLQGPWSWSCYVDTIPWSVDAFCKSGPEYTE